MHNWLPLVRLLTDAGLIAIADNCPKLRIVTFVDMKHITDQDITEFVSRNHNLEEIWFHTYTCTQLTDISLIAIAANCHKLKSLTLSAVLLVTDEGCVHTASVQ